MVRLQVDVVTLLHRSKTCSRWIPSLCNVRKGLQQTTKVASCNPTMLTERHEIMRFLVIVGVRSVGWFCELQQWDERESLRYVQTILPHSLSLGVQTQLIRAAPHLPFLIRSHSIFRRFFYSRASGIFVFFQLSATPSRLVS